MKNTTKTTGQRRDYKAEYRRRLARAAARGLSRSQARGHARPGEVLIRAQKATKGTGPLEAALKELHNGASLQRAARGAHVSPERLRRYLSDRGLAKRVGRKWQVTDERPREMTVITDGRIQNLILKNFDNASLNGRHKAAVGLALANNTESYLEPFDGQSVIDVKGKSHVLETDLATRYSIVHAGSDVFEQVYRLIQ